MEKESITITQVLKMIKSRQITPENGLTFYKELDRVARNKKLTTAEDTQIMYYQNAWEMRGLDSAAVGDIIPGILLVFDINDTISTYLKDYLKSRGENPAIILVKPGDTYREVGKFAYEINPVNLLDYEKLFAELKKQDLLPNRLLYLWFVGESSLTDSSTFFFLIKVQGQLKNKSLTRLVVVYDHDGQDRQPSLEALAGYAGSLRQIWPHLTFSTVGIPVSHLDAGDTAGLILQELQENNAASEIRYEQGRRYIKRLRPLEMKVTGETKLRKHGAYLITGGAGGLGLIMAKHLAAKYQAKLVLTGRSPLSQTKKNQIVELEALGAEVLYLQADVANKQDMQTIVRTFKEHFGSINGVIHSAGSIDQKPLNKKDIVDFSATLRPKTIGTSILDEVTKDEPLDFFVMFSSVASILGDGGQCDYAVANRFLDSFPDLREKLRLQKLRQGRTIVINWPLWREGGMHLSKEGESLYLKYSGMSYLEREKGLEAFEIILDNCCLQVVVIHGSRTRFEKFLNSHDEKSESSAKPVISKPVKQLRQSLLGDEKGITLEQRLEKDIQRIASGLVRMEPDSMDTEENLGNFGFDSITLKEFAFKLGETCQEEIYPTVFFAHSSIRSIAQYILREFEDKIRESYAQINKAQDEIIDNPKEETIKLKDLDRKAVAAFATGNIAIPGKSVKLGEEPIAIIGASGLFPGSKNLDEFWRNLEEEKDLISEIPVDRWDWKNYYCEDNSELNKTSSKWGGFIEDVDKFDAKFFNISPREAELMDPQQRLFLETVWKTIEDSGHKSSEFFGKDIGVFVGAQSNDYQELSGKYTGLKAQTATGNCHAMLANRVSYFFNLNGPSEVIDTACSSGLVAVHRAVKAIRNGECEAAVAGAVSLMLSPTSFLAAGKLGILSPEGKCRTFDKDANGYVKGEGIGAVLLKPLSKAIEDLDHIYAVIKGSAVNHGGKANSLTAPNSEAQAALLLNAYDSAGFEPETITYIETHGTGTELGDPVEVEGLKKAFNQLAKRRRSPITKNYYCGLGSVKTNIGHLEPAAGIAGLLKVVLALKNEKLPGTLNLRKLNPYINLSGTPFYIVEKTKYWERLTDSKGQLLPRRAGVSSFGFGGSNAHVVLEEYVKQNIQDERREEAEIVILSAKNKDRLKVYAWQLVEFLQKNKLITRPPADDNLVSCICTDLIKLAADIIEVSEKDLDKEENLNEYGLDLVSINEFAERIADKYKIERNMGCFTGNPSIQNVAEKLVKEQGNSMANFYSSLAGANTMDDRETNVISLKDIAYTLQIGREVMEERLALIVTSKEELIDKLSAFSNGNVNDNVFTGNAKAGFSLDGLLDGREREESIKSIIMERELAKLAKIWVSGAAVDWHILHTDPVRRISLPSYPFKLERHWLSETTQKEYDSPVNQGQTGVLEHKRIILEKTWQESELGERISGEIKGKVLVFTNNLANALAGKLFKDTPSVDPVFIEHSSDYIRESKNKYYLNFTRADHGSKLASDILGDDEPVSGVIDLSDLLDIPVERPELCKGKIILLQELIKNIGTNSFFQLHVTRGLQSFQTCEATLQGADMAGLTKMLGAEYSRVQAKTIDIDVATTFASSIKEWVLAELQLWSSESEICYRQGKRYVPLMKEIYNEPTGIAGNVVKPLKDSDKVIVITGGTRGIGAEVARYLADKDVKKLVLMGLQEFPPRYQWEELLRDSGGNPSRTLEKIKRIITLEERGVKVALYCGSLTDKDKLNNFFAQVRENLGEIGGVIHCAGLGSDTNPAFINKNFQDMERVFEPKITGLQVLHELFVDDKLDFFVLFSSVSGLVPTLAVGISDYALANSYMDYFSSFQHQKGNKYYKSVNWPSWKEVGMGEIKSPAYLKNGLTAHPTSEGLALLDLVMELENKATVMPCVAIEGKFAPDSLLRANQRKKRSEDKPALKVSPSVYPRAASRTKWLLKELFAKELKIPVAELDEDTLFGEFGVDSIMIAELVKKTEKEFKQNIDPAVFLEFPTLNSLSTYLEQNLLVEPVVEPVSEGMNNILYSSNEAHFALKSNDSEKGSFTINQKVAVIGIACRFPGAKDRETFWNNLVAGKSSISVVPTARWDVDQYYSPVYLKGKSISKWGGFIENIEYFDPKYFGLKEEIAHQMDPLARHFMELSVETLRDAGYEREELSNRKVGVFVGSRSGSYHEGLKEILPDTIIASGQNFIAAHVSHFFNFRGPSMVMDTACSSSLVSIHLACQSLMMEESDLALAGGVDLLLDEKPYLLLSEAKALSPDGKCHTFDEKANGFVPGEGCGAVLLKPLNKALADGDRIYAIIESSAVNNDGHTMGITTPNPEAQREVIREALRRGQITPGSVSYVETHGTGTMIGDPFELKALTQVFRESTEEQQFCAVGSVKTNIGHLLTAAGIASFIKVVLALKNGQLPPTLNCEMPNPRFKFDSSPFYPNTCLQEWLPREGLRRAGISSFGFGGTNIHMIVSEYDASLFKQNPLRRNPLPPIAFNKKRYWLEEKLKLVSDPKKEKLTIPMAHNDFYSLLQLRKK